MRFVWITFFALLTGVASWIRVPLPFTPVPLTLQTAVVLACAISLGRDGVYAQLLYLLLGGLGLPMFASGLFGPTGGYLIGFVAAAWVAGRWLQPGWSRLNYVGRALSLCGISLVILVFGVIQLSLFSGLSLSRAAILGFVPFVLGDFVKALAVAALPKRVL